MEEMKTGRFAVCKHPNHTDETDCGNRAIGCSKYCLCCMGKELAIELPEMKHTPGPWAWSDESSPPRHQYGDGSWLQSQSGMVLDYAGCGSHECKVTHANACLIAAAPELLDAHEPDRAGPEFLNWVADRLVMHGDNQNSDFVLCLRRRSEKAKAAIAKATGVK